MKQSHSLDDVLATYLDAERLGKAPPPEALLATYPDLAVELQSFLADRERFRRTANSIPPVPFSSLNPAGFAAPPRNIGNYEIVGELGRGGMGVVYKALQPKLKRLVALKMVLHAGHAGPQELARFRTEGEAVARLQHPNIIHVYEVGEYDGRPFFSLEFVDGGSLAQRINGQPQPTRQAAALVETLAQAMEYAHRQGIVHRDLKPANVLLTGHGMPKITDFGLAKRMEQDDGQTRTGAILGTPSYIAPEQAAGKKDVGPAADIYALGAILYEMLTGRPPFRGESPMDTMLQVMGDTVVSPSRLQPKVPRDLETICLKCLEKEPRKRYASAAALAGDLRRFLNGESIAARPAGSVERTWRWCRRRPLVAALILAVALTGFSGVGGVFYMWRQAEGNLKKLKQEQAEVKRQRDEAEKQRKLAEANLRQAQDAVNQFYTIVSESPDLKFTSLQPLRRRLLEKALRYYQDFLKQQGSNPVLRKELAYIHYYAGKVIYEIGAKSDALKEFQQARALCEKLRLAAACDLAIGRIMNDLGRDVDALNSYQRAEAAFSKLLAGAGTPAEAAALRDNLIFLYMDLGKLHAGAGRIDEAVRFYEQNRKFLEAAPPTTDHRFRLVLCYRNLALQYAKRGRSAEGQALLAKALPLAEALAREFPNYAEPQYQVAGIHTALGHLAAEAGNHAQALASFQKANAIFNRIVQLVPTITQYRVSQAENQFNLGNALRELKRSAEAIGPLSRACDLLVKLLHADPTVIHYRAMLASCWTTLGAAQVEAGQLAPARQSLKQALELWEKLVREHPQNAEFRKERDETAANLKKLSEKR